MCIGFTIGFCPCEQILIRFEEKIIILSEDDLFLYSVILVKAIFLDIGKKKKVLYNFVSGGVMTRMS